MAPMLRNTLKIVVVVFLLAIPIVIYNRPCTATAYDLGIIEAFFQTTEKGDEFENNFTTTVLPKSGNQLVNNFICQYDSKGIINQRHRISKDGLLKDVDEISVANESIFFLETSCLADLNSRQSCAVESAARENPEKQVYVLFVSPVANLGPDGGQNMMKLKSIYANINFLYVDIVNYTKGTKLEKWIENQTLSTSSFKVAHLSDALRTLTLYKYGGIYIDLDVVVMHSLKNMSNFAGDQLVEALNSALMSMKANGTLVNACLDEFVNDYHGNLWSYNGPDLIERVIRKKCERKSRMLWKNCDGDFLVYPIPKFYPVAWDKWHAYFEEYNEKKFQELFGNSFAVHLWNKMSKKTKVKVGSNIIYGVIASKHCPMSYWNSGQFF